MPPRVFQTARFKIHNPSRHKQTMLMTALRGYHDTAKSVLEKALSDPEFEQQCTRPNIKGIPVPNGFTTAKYIRRLTPKGWNLAPLTDYLIADVSDALMSHLAKKFKAKNDSNPPTIAGLAPITEQQYLEAYQDLTLTHAFPPKPEHQSIIDEERLKGNTRVAHRLERVFSARALTKSASQLLRKLEGPMPRPIEFRHCEFKRGFMLGKRGTNYYLMVRLFGRESRYTKTQKAKHPTMQEGFIDVRTGEDISGKAYPGLILPLELGREFHESEYLRYGKPQSAKLLARQSESGEIEFYVHIAFEFAPEQITPTAVLGLDRGAAKIGSASVLAMDGSVIESSINLEGAAFSADMAEHRKRIAALQQRGIQKTRKFKLRGRKADALLGEYANLLIQKAKQHSCQIVLEKIDGPMMGRFLTQSQFAKLKSQLTYKALRVGLPEPIEIPAARTSQTCASCGHWAKENRPRKDSAGKPLQDVFLCVVCTHSANADENASIIIALRGLHLLQTGGRFTKWTVFEPWLKSVLGRDGQETVQ